MINNKTLVNGLWTMYVAADDRGLNFGDGLFETIAVHNSQMLFWDAHWSRLQQGCECLAINCPDESIVLDDIKRVIGDQPEGVLKLVITRGRSRQGYRFAPDHVTTRVVRYLPWPGQVEEINNQGIAVKYSRHRLGMSAFAGIKHLNRIEQIMAGAELHKTNFAEVICCDENDNIIECSSANIFMVRDNRLYTPRLDRHGIRGVMRDRVLMYAQQHEIPTSETTISKNMLHTADEVFITNSIIGIRPVVQIENTRFATGRLTRQWQAAYEMEKNTRSQ